MREILFRGKRIDNGEWVYGDLVHSQYKIGDTCVGQYGNTVGIHQVYPETVGQYIELPDKNGKKIFEGDIVKDISLYLTHKNYFEHGCQGEENYETYREKAKPTLVTFATENVGSCGCCFNYFVGSGFIAHSVDLSCCEVIGNIHDNPELLRPKEG